MDGGGVPKELAASVGGVCDALSRIVKVAARAPETKGVNVLLIVQLLLFKMEIPQVLFCEKSPLLAPVNPKLVKFKALPELFVRVIGCEPLVKPTRMFPNSRLVGLRSTGSDCRKTGILFEVPLATATSSAPSPLKSPVATPDAPAAVVNACAAAKVPSPRPVT